MKPVNDNTRFLAADVANLEAEIDALLAAFPDLQEDETLRADMLEGETSLQAVLTRLLGHEREAASMVTAIAGRLSELQGRKSRQERKKEAMRALIYRLLKAADMPKVALAEATISIGKKPAAVEIVDETALPKKFLRVTTSPDKAAIKEALVAGKTVKGAKMGEPGETLTVRAS
ncbi:siphovirus Gp157 family protein [Rhizobium sp. 12,4]|uniref:siphovirus Gp157 family protein n=1 Tax=Rhizobium sp. 12,4 TaxID=3405135 RepID=UPI003D32FB5C